MTDEHINCIGTGCKAATLVARLADAEGKLKRITDAYAAYRGKGVAPAPVEYANVVAAILAATPNGVADTP